MWYKSEQIEYTCCRSPELRVSKRTSLLVSISFKQIFTSNIGGGTRSSIEFIYNGLFAKTFRVFSGILEILINASS